MRLLERAAVMASSGPGGPSALNWLHIPLLSSYILQYPLAARCIVDVLHFLV